MKNTFYILIIFILLAACEKPEKFHEIDGYGPVYLRYKPDTPLISAYDAYDLYANKPNIYDDAYIINSQEEYEEKIVSKGYYFYPEVDFNKKMVYGKYSKTGLALMTNNNMSMTLKCNEDGTKYMLEHSIDRGDSKYLWIHGLNFQHTLPKINNDEIIITRDVYNNMGDSKFNEDKKKHLTGTYKGIYYYGSGDTANNYTLEIKEMSLNDEFCVNCSFDRDAGIYLINVKADEVYQINRINSIGEDLLYYHDDKCAFKYFIDINEIEVFLNTRHYNKRFFIGKKQ